MLYRHEGEISGYGKAVVKLLPHGSIEIPALLIAASYGLWLGVMVVRRIRGKEEKVRQHIMHAIRRYFAIVLPLLVVASVTKRIGPLPKK